MPFVYGVAPAVNFTTSATPNTELDALFIKPGTRNVGLISIGLQGKGSNLTSLSGLINRVKKWTTTASAGGSAVTPAPRDPGAQAAKSTAGQASAGVTPGTGGPVVQLAVGCSGTGPGSWSWLNNPDSAIMLEGSANQSIDLFNSSTTPSLAHEVSCDIME